MHRKVLPDGRFAVRGASMSGSPGDVSPAAVGGSPGGWGRARFGGQDDDGVVAAVRGGLGVDGDG